jgi:hypothetical protein
MRLMSLVILLSLGLALAASDNETAGKHTLVSFVTTEKYRQLPPASRTVYLSGWLDGRLNAGYIGGTAEAIESQRQCVIGKTDTQITAIVDKYIADHPETWNRPAALEADDALQSICPDLKRTMDGLLLRRR